MSKGKLIVVEGACDGIGKTTQYKMLKERLLADKKELITHHFPSYNTYQGKPVELYLQGHYGKVEDLPEYFINGLYAMDRAITWYETLKKEYESGKTLLFDRYTTSTLIYQSAILKTLEEKKSFIDFVCDYEYNKLGIKEPDKVIFLTADFDLVTKLRNERKSNEGVVNDIHEENLDFMKKVYENATFVADYLKWQVVNCEKNGKFDTKENIHEKVYQLVNTK